MCSSKDKVAGRATATNSCCSISTADFINGRSLCKLASRISGASCRDHSFQGMCCSIVFTTGRSSLPGRYSTNGSYAKWTAGSVSAIHTA